MPQIMVRPFMAGTMIEGATGVKARPGRCSGGGS
jgi:hypothetical protein